MINPQKENRVESSETSYSKDLVNSANPVPDAETVDPAETPKPDLQPKSTPSSNEIEENKPSKPPIVLAKPAESRDKPTPAPVRAMAPKVQRAATDSASSPVTDSSISIDVDGSPNVGALIIDAIAAAVAIAFTVLLVQDIIPFL